MYPCLMEMLDRLMLPSLALHAHPLKINSNLCSKF